MNKSIYIIILFYFVPFLVKGYSLPPLKNYGTCKDVYNDSITNEYTIISKKDASVVWYRAVNASDTIVVLSLKSKPQLEVGEQYRLTLGKISRLKILKGRYSALIFDKDTVFLGITFSREDCELQIKTYHLLLDVESIKVLNQEDVSSPKGSIWPPPPYFHYRGDSASYQLSLQRILFLADNRYLKDKYVFDDGIRQIILSFVNDKVMKVEITDWRSLRHTCFGSSCLSFVETYAYHHLKDMRTIKVDSLIATTRELEKKKKKKENDYIHPFEYKRKKSSNYSLFPSLEGNIIRFSGYFDKLQILDFLFVVE